MFLEEYFKCSVMKGFHYPTIVKFFGFDKCSDLVPCLAIDDQMLGYDEGPSAKDYTKFPEGLDSIFNPSLIDKYHYKAKIFEVNVLPIAPSKLKVVEEKLEVMNQLIKSANLERLNRKVKKKEADKLSAGIEAVFSEVLGSLTDDVGFKKPEEGLQSLRESKQFEENPESYIDYSSLIVSPSIDQVFNSDTEHFLVISKFKLNARKRYCAIRDCRELLTNHYRLDCPQFGLKIPRRSDPFFIVQLVLYLQILLDERDMQNEALGDFFGLESTLWRHLNEVDSDCLLNGVQVVLHSVNASGTTSKVSGEPIAAKVSSLSQATADGDSQHSLQEPEKPDKQVISYEFSLRIHVTSSANGRYTRNKCCSQRNM